LIQLDRVLVTPASTDSLWLVDRMAAVTGTQHRYCFRVSVSSNSASLPTSLVFKATLVWSDYPGESYSTKNLVNDLDLSVTAAGVVGGPNLQAPLRGNHQLWAPVSGVGGGGVEPGGLPLLRVEKHGEAMPGSTFTYVAAEFGGAIPSTSQSAIVTRLVRAVPADACVTSPITLTAPSVGFYSGAVVLVDRGTCTFTDKVAAAQALGALAVVVVNYDNSDILMSGTDASLTIPAVAVHLSTGIALDAALSRSSATGGAVSMRLGPAPVLVDTPTPIRSASSPDTTNNVEQVILALQLPAGNNTFAVAAFVSGTSVPHGPQPYALVITAPDLQLTEMACATATISPPTPPTPPIPQPTPTPPTPEPTVAPTTAPTAPFCYWEADGVCDVPTYCPAGSDKADCSPPFCQYEGDGVCDVPTYCPAGSDVADCGCQYESDGVCDVPAYCPAGSDVADCGPTCQYESDGECDVPAYCPAGSDVADCGPTCQWESDGECDVPAYCPAGSDVADCGPTCQWESDGE
jgi:hypothetical protein